MGVDDEVSVDEVVGDGVGVVVGDGGTNVSSRTRALLLSNTYTFRPASMAMPVGLLNWAKTANPPSPPNPDAKLPLPPTVKMSDNAATTTRTQLFPLSTTNASPLDARAMALG